MICRSLAIHLLDLPPFPSGWEVRHLLLDLHPYSGTDPLGMFPLFLRTAAVISPHLSVVFWWLVCLGSFPLCWRQANVKPIPKGTQSSVAKYIPISITSVLSKVFERLVSIRLGQFIECNGVLPTTQFAYWKGMGTCDALLWVSHTLQSALESWQEARIVQIDFSAAFDRVNNQGILYRLCSWVLEVLCCLYLHCFCLTDHSTFWWMVVGINWLRLFQECRRAVFWAHYCSFRTLRSFFPFWIGYADDSTLMAAVPSPGVSSVTVAEFLIHDLGRVSEWCDLWGIKLNTSKTKTMIVSLSHTMHPQSPPLSIGGTVFEVSDDLAMLGDIWFQTELWEASLLCFWSSFSKTWYLELVLVRVP